MKPARGKRWFWVTLAFLFLFTLSVCSWALIFSPLQFDPKILGHFESEMNGSKQDNLIWVNDGSLKDLQGLIEKDWARAGWKPVAQGTDFAPSLLGFEKNSEVLSPYLQMKVFQKNETLRALSLMQDSQGDRTYGWVAETPKDILDLAKARAHWDFPFTPPKSATRLICQRNPKFQIAFIFLPKSQNLPRTFQGLCEDQGFQTKPFQNSPGHLGYLVHRGPARLLALLDQDGKDDLISLVHFLKN